MLICAADIMRMTGRSRRTAWRMMAAIRDHYNKLKYAPLTLDEFCQTQLLLVGRQGAVEDIHGILTQHLAERLTQLLDRRP